MVFGFVNKEGINMIETFSRISITHFPNGNPVPDHSNHILHLMEDLSVIGNYFGPTVLTDGVFNAEKDTVRFEWYQNRPDVAGSLTISVDKFVTETGCAYSGSSYQQDIPSNKQNAVIAWMNRFDVSAGWSAAFEYNNFYAMFNSAVEEGRSAPHDAVNPYNPEGGNFSKENYDITIKRLGFARGFLERGKL